MYHLQPSTPSPLQRRMLKELLQHLDELNVHIENLNDEIDNFMKPEEKQASQVIQDVTGIGNTSAQTIIAVIGTDMERFPSDRHMRHRGQGYVRGTM